MVWDYEYLGGHLETSGPVPAEDVVQAKGSRRLVTAEKSLFIPLGIRTRLLVTSGDVLHSFSTRYRDQDRCSPWEIKRNVFSPTAQAFYGRCSELCGANHSFMPITVAVCLLRYFYLSC